MTRPSWHLPLLPADAPPVQRQADTHTCRHVAHSREEEEVERGRKRSASWQAGRGGRGEGVEARGWTHGREGERARAHAHMDTPRGRSEAAGGHAPTHTYSRASGRGGQERRRRRRASPRPRAHARATRAHTHTHHDDLPGDILPKRGQGGARAGGRGGGGGDGRGGRCAGRRLKWELYSTGRAQGERARRPTCPHERGGGERAAGGTQGSTPCHTAAARKRGRGEKNNPTATTTIRPPPWRVSGEIELGRRKCARAGAHARLTSSI